jgi:hypothetical protein
VAKNKSKTAGKGKSKPKSQPKPKLKAAGKPAPKTAAKAAPKPVAKPSAPPKRVSGPPAAGAPRPPEAAKTASGTPAPTSPGTVPAAGRAPVRTPVGAEELKAKIGQLATAINQIKALKRSLNKSFYEVGLILGQIQSKRLFEVKGYGSFEAFLEREIDLGKTASLRMLRIAQTFIREAALAAGLDRASAALAALDGETEQSGGAGAVAPAAPATGAPRSSAIPLHKQ